MNDIHPNYLSIKDLSVGWSNKKTTHRLLNDVSFSIPRGKTLALVGESGSGKSLTALSIAQLLPTGLVYDIRSKIQLDKLSILDLPEYQMQILRGRRIGFVFQEPMVALNPVLTIGQQLAEAKYTHIPQAKFKTKDLIELLTAVGISYPSECLEFYPHQLSGGMKQRVMIAMALAGEPDLLIADEPTTAVDVAIQQQILSLLKQIQQTRSLSMLFITHDFSVVKEIADDIAVMYKGEIVEYAAVKEFFTHPQHPYSIQLLAAIPSYEKRDQALPVTVSQLAAPKLGCAFMPRCPWALEACQLEKPALKQRATQHLVRCLLPYPPKLSTTADPDKTSIAEKKVHDKLLALDAVDIYFPIKKGIFKRTVGVVKAVDKVSFELIQGETLALVGESGSGKTSLAKAIIGLLPLTHGHITQYSKGSMEMIFQDPYSSLNPKMVVADLIAEGLRARGEKIKQASTHPAVLTVLEQVGLSREVVHSYPHEFSGGQRQRIAIARALILSPSILICDEPTSALDLSVQAQILNLLKNLQKELGLSYLFITHNLSVVAYIADRVLVMRQGKILEQGPIAEILYSPRHEYTKTLLTHL